jgi:hypothetical protein
MSDRRIASRLAFTSLLCGLIWLELGGMVSAQQVSADEIINALAPPRVTRGLRARAADRQRIGPGVYREPAPPHTFPHNHGRG